MKIITIVGARPQFIKAAAVSRAIQKFNQKDSAQSIHEVMVHTGQHYDDNMSRVFFDELEIHSPDYHLGLGSGSHAEMTGAMLSKIESVLIKEKPDFLLVYGDTNSTLAGALAAVKLHIPVAHVEAGLRSFNRRMPEEINRVLTDHVSTLLFSPTEVAVTNLKREGIEQGVFKVGDVMLDSFLFNRRLAEKKSSVLSALELTANGYALVTIHREENTDDRSTLINVLTALDKLAEADFPFIVPLHPRTRKAIAQLKDNPLSNSHVRFIDPVSYLDMVVLESNSKIILTDSGGVQKEAYFARKPCITLREETEWVELVNLGVNITVGSDPEKICNATVKMMNKSVVFRDDVYGNGSTCEKIVDILKG